MPSPEISIICVDGLSNNGKTTLIDTLRAEYEAHGIPVVVRRGDGSRRGTGTPGSADPPSQWWQEHYAEIASAGVEGPESEAAAEMASRKLLDELYELRYHDFPAQLEAAGQGRGVILLDRGPISRLFVARRYRPGISLEDALGIDEDPKLAGVIPDYIIVLRATQQVLLERNEGREAAKREFNRFIIMRYFADFESLVDDLPSELMERTTIVDSDQAMRDIGSFVLSLTVDRTDA